ncbi:histidine ammonia-lyase [Schleiferia thermophila]
MHLEIREVHWIDFKQLYEFYFHKNVQISLAPEVWHRIETTREQFEQVMFKIQSPVYGVNTGFGSLCNVKISEDQLADLQRNIVVSHACGTGPYAGDEIVRYMLYLKIISLAKGYSAVTSATIRGLMTLLNHNVLPYVPKYGSLGASGDLAPLAHLSLPLLLAGEVYENTAKKRASECELLKSAGFPIALKSKEGLALLNGTQYMSAGLTVALVRAFRIFHLSALISAISLEAFLARREPFDALIHEVRPFRGQQKVAQFVQSLLNDSEFKYQERSWVQDPYSFRCIPQVLGATLDTLNYALNLLLTEVNSVTDNPLFFCNEEVILSGGNFHGQPLAYAADFAAIAIHELANIAERRIFILLSGQRDLPPFLVMNLGLNSGLMIMQYSAAALVSASRQLCTPASVDSIVSSNGQEDHVSMGANAVNKLLEVVDLVERVIAMELIAASQALVFRKGKINQHLEDFLSLFRDGVPPIENDRELSIDLQRAVDFIKTYPISFEHIQYWISQNE